MRPISFPVISVLTEPDSGTLIISSPIGMKRLENVRRHPEVAMLFSPVGTGKGEPPHVVLVQGRGRRDRSGERMETLLRGLGTTTPPSRENLSKMSQMMPGYVQRAIIRVRPTRFLGWQEGDLQRAPEVVEVQR